MFKVQSDRVVIINSLFKTLQSKDEDIAYTTMQIFVEIAKTQYDIVESYLPTLLEATAFLAKSEERVGAQAIEFWTSLAEEEYRRVQKNGHNKNYIAQVTQQLIVILLEGVQRVNIQDEDDDSDEIGVALSSGCCINAISSLVGTQIMQ